MATGTNKNSLGEIKFAVADILYEVLGLKAQKAVDKVEKAKTYDEVKAHVFEMIRSEPGVTGKMDVINRLKNALN